MEAAGEQPATAGFRAASLGGEGANAVSRLEKTGPSWSSLASSPSLPVVGVVARMLWWRRPSVGSDVLQFKFRQDTLSRSRSRNLHNLFKHADCVRTDRRRQAPFICRCK
jgi:hypothetical protein